MSITLDRWEIQTESGLLPTVASDDAPAPTLYDTAALGEQKILICEYTSVDSVLDQQIYFNPAMFADDALTFYPQIKPIVGWVLGVTSDTVLDTYQRMHFFGTETTKRNNLNYDAEILIETGYLGFKIKLTFYMSTDLNDFVTGRRISNVDRFTLTTVDVCQDSVYQADKHIRPYTYLLNPVTGTRCFTERPTTGVADIKITARDACKGLYEAAPEIDITFQLKRNGNIVTNFSTYEDTDVIVCEDYENLTGSKVFVMRINDEDDNKDFICDLSLFTPPTTTEKPSKLLLETGDFLLLETGDMMLLEDGSGILFTMPKEQVSEDGIYKVFVCLYDDTIPLVNSCCSDDINGLGIPEATEAVITSSFIDFYNTYTDNNYLAAPLQEVQNKLVTDSVTFNTTIQGKLGTTETYNDYFEKLDIKIFEEVVSGSNTTEQIYAKATIKRNTEGYFIESQSAGITSLVVTENSDTNYDIAFQFATRSETETLNEETIFNGAKLAVPTGNQNWVGKPLTIRYETTMNYYNASLPYQDVLRYDQIIDTDSFDSGAIINNVFPSDGFGIPIQKICSDQDFCMVVETVSATAYNVIGVIARENYSLLSSGYAVGVLGNIILKPVPGQEFVNTIDTNVNPATKKAEMCLSYEELVEKSLYGFTFILQI